jgi:hypothetical protein
LGSIGGITAADELEAFHLGAISILLADGARAELQKGLGGRKARTRAWKAEAAKSAVLMGYSRARYCFKKRPVSTRQLPPRHQRATLSLGSYLQNTSVPHCHSVVTSKTPVCHVVTRQLLPKHQRATLSPDGYSHIITRLLPSAWPAQPVLIRPLSLKRRCYLQSLGSYL